MLLFILIINGLYEFVFIVAGALDFCLTFVSTLQYFSSNSLEHIDALFQSMMLNYIQLITVILSISLMDCLNET